MFAKPAILTAILVVTNVAVVAAAAEWGSIKGRIVVDGTPPKLAPLEITKDQFCIEKKPANDSVIVGKDNGLVNAVVYLRVPKVGPKVTIHPDYDAKLKEPVVLENKNCAFRPHVFLARVGQAVEVRNLDPVGHNTNISLFAYGQLIPAAPIASIKVTQSANVPMPVVCNIHPWMKGYVLSLEHPYAAITDDDGKFEIKNIPVGEREFQFWHETGYLKDVKAKDKRTDNRGRVKLAIAGNKTLDLGDIKVKAESLDVRR